MTNLTPEQAAIIRANEDALRAWLKANNRHSYRQEELPADIRLNTNGERSALEIFEFMRDKPKRYFLYINPPSFVLPHGVERQYRSNELRGRSGTATTWTGDKLGTVQFGCAYQDNFGGTRVPVTVQAISGDTYHGTYFASAGSYARIKKSKQK